ncbi:MAG: NUDIX domain-containing protein [Stellaceae bacterium]
MPDLLISSRTPLVVGDAVGAIIRVESDGYLMQLRDSKPDIWYPGHWGLFGGGVEADEDPMAALKRELREELELEIETAAFFARIDFDVGSLPLLHFYRSYYIVSISRAVESRLVVHEGAAKRLFPGDEILEAPNVTPYDAFALFLYHARGRLTDWA